MEQSNTKLVAIVYPSMDTAEEVLNNLQGMQSKYLIDIDDAAFVTKDKNGKVKIHQTSHPVAGGTAGGAFWGLLIGALFLAPIFGLLLGAGTGALAGKLAEAGVDKNFTKSIGSKLKPGTSALFVLVRSVTADKVVPELSKYGGTVVQTNLSKKAEAALQKELRHGELKEQKATKNHMMAA
jgi:uncharacterized membrane protein